MGDFSHLSDEELNAMIAAQSGVAPGMDLSSISDAQLDQMITAQGGDYSLLEAGKQFGSGAIEGTAGLFGTLSDLGEMLSPYGHTPGKFSFDRTQQAINTIQPVVAEPNEQYRYSRIMGDFLGPSMVTGGIGKALQLAGKLPQVGSFLRSLSTPSALAADAGGAVVSQAAQDIAPDSTAAPVLGAVFGSAGTSTAIQTGKGLRRALGGLNESEMMQSAAYVLQKMGLSPDQIDDALKRLPPDELASLMSTAEVTGNAGMAQLEEYLTQVGVGSGKKVARAAKRADARDAVLDTLSTAGKQNVEGLGGDLRAAGYATREAMDEAAHAKWGKYPRNKRVATGKLRSRVAKIVDRRQAGLDTNSRVTNLVEQISASDEMTSGALQDIRSDALWATRELNLKPYEKEILAEIADGVDEAIKQQSKMPTYLPPDEAFRAAGYDVDNPLYHGTNRQFDEIDPLYASGKTSGTGAFLTPDPEVASTYARTGGRGGGNVRPVYTKKAKQLVIEVDDRNWNDIRPQDGIIRHADGTDDELFDYFGFEHGETASTDDIARAARERGYSSVKIEGVKDQGSDNLFNEADRFLREKYGYESPTNLVGNPKVPESHRVEALQHARGVERYGTIEVVFDRGSVRSKFDPPKIKDPKGLNQGDYATYKQARAATKEKAETFARGTAGGKLVNESIEESNLIRRTFTGDKKAVKQLAKAIDNDPSLMERYKAAVIDTVKRNSDGELTKAKVNDFLQKNINGLEELYGTNGVKRIKRVLDDLRSADNVGSLANQASRGQSATQQKLRVAGAIKQMVNSRGGSRVPIIGAILDDLGETAALKSTGGIEALLLEAAFDPVLAKELVKLPTPERMKTALEGLVSYAKKTGTAAGRGAGLATLSEMEPNTRQSQPLRVRPSTLEDLTLNQPQNAGYAQGRGTNNQGMQPLRRPEEAPRGIEQYSASVQPTPTPAPRQPVTASGQVRDVKAFIKQQDPLIQAIIKVESNGDPKAGSHRGAQGLMQLMPQIQKAFNVSDPHDPRQNVAAGIKLLEEEWKRFGDARLALAAYNAGSPAVRKAIKKAGSKSWSQVARFLPRETRNYVPKVLKEYRALA